MVVVLVFLMTVETQLVASSSSIALRCSRHRFSRLAPLTLAPLALAPLATHLPFCKHSAAVPHESPTPSISAP